ncbi:MAG: lytic murein transglycosylase B [Zetaproteobacteria bacterium]|nr:lytic murein transglycosylase B [Zetaproteobacteria bacterium]
MGVAAVAITSSTLPSPLFAAAKEALNHQRLIEQLHKQTSIPKERLHAYLKNATFDEQIIRKMNTPYESKTYGQYRPLFVHERLAAKGRDYLATHHDIFIKCYQRYGVQPEIIAAILGMETRYGAYRGKDRVLDALYTLATGYPRRAEFFANQLGEFFLLCEEEKLNPHEVQGSYAGAFGTTQFIPSSYRAFAVDADHDGKRDVWNSPSDIIFSVGNYFNRHQWRDDRPIAQWIPDLPSHPLTNQMLNDETKSWKKLQELRDANIANLPQSWHDDDRVALIQRETETGKRTALVHYNFYVITRWNRSYNYALAISELAHLLGCPQCNIES